MTAMISSTVGGSAGYPRPLLCGGRPAWNAARVAGERRRPAISTSTVDGMRRSLGRVDQAIVSPRSPPSTHDRVSRIPITRALDAPRFLSAQRTTLFALDTESAFSEEPESASTDLSLTARRYDSVDRRDSGVEVRPDAEEQARSDDEDWAGRSTRVGSGKLANPCARMHLANLSAARNWLSVALTPPEAPPGASRAHALRADLNAGDCGLIPAPARLSPPPPPLGRGRSARRLRACSPQTSAPGTRFHGLSCATTRTRRPRPRS